MHVLWTPPKFVVMHHIVWAMQVNRSHLYLWCANYWLTNRVRLLGSIVCGAAALFLVLDVKNIDGATGGLVLTYM